MGYPHLRGRGEKTDGGREIAPSGLWSGERTFFASQRMERAVPHLPSPILHLLLAASRDAALIQLMLVFTSYEGRSRALFNDTAPRVTGRSAGRDREVWMGCRASLTAAVLNVRRMGMRCGRAPQIAIPPSRPATPRAPTRRFSCNSVQRYRLHREH